MPADPNRVRDLFLEAVEFPPDQRPAYLAGACQGDAELRAEVDRLLIANSDPDSILESLYPTLGDASVAIDPDAPIPTEIATEEQIPDGATGTTDLPDPDAITVAASTPRAARVATDEGIGTVIAGRYTLVDVIGEGGMGSVYLASQTEPIRRQVALKLIKTGMNSRGLLARFDAERQALALMDHPNIARIYDGGLTPAGQPFFVMELVKGVPLTQYCDQRRLTVQARLELFIAICQAVQHAHQKGIIHRDLKPGNVLVTEVDGRPTPKVIDFGVAKATDLKLTEMSLGDAGAIVGTPAYMSPEQADPSSMDIDTRTDVYALGVMLYELLTGSPPIDAAQFRRGALLEMLRMVREVEPSKPSNKVSTADALPNIAANRGIDPERLKRELRGDLDWIVMKALEKDRTRRYETASGFAVDILRHLSNEPVQAAPPSRAYRLRKFVRKHRAGVLAASLVLFALLAGIAGTTWGLIEAKRQAELANKRELGERLAKQEALAAADQEKKAKETVEDVLGFVEDKILAAARPKNQEGGLGFDVKLADAIKAALPAIETRFRDKPLTEARLRRTIGTSFHYLGKPEISEGQFEAARALYTRELGPDHPDTLWIMNRLAIAYSDLGKTVESLKLREETLALRKARLGPDHVDTIASRGNLALGYLAVGRNAEAVKLGEETLALLKAKLGPGHLDTIKCMQILVMGYTSLGRDAQALDLQEKALGLARNGIGPDHPETIRIIHNLAAQYAALGRNVEALKLGEEELALRRKKFGPDNPLTLNSMRNVAAFLTTLGRLADAVTLREEALPLQKTNLGPAHPETLKNMVYLAASYDALGRQADAIKLYEEVLALKKTKFGLDNPDTLASLRSLALSDLAAGRIPEATALLEQALDQKDPESSLWLAALQAWFGQDQQYAATRRRFLAFARGTSNAETANRAARAGALHPSTDPSELEALLVLGRMAVDNNKGGWELLALGMAEYRNGHFAAADEALLATETAGKESIVAEIAAFYRAMSLFRQGKKDESRKLATAVALKMKPLPKDEQNPMRDGARLDYLVLWLAYKEARVMTGFDPPPAPARADGK